MYELERKARVDHRVIRTRLEELDLVPETDLKQIDTYLNHPSRDFAETDEALRIRCAHPTGSPEAVTVELTYKGPRLPADAKTRDERTARIADHQDLDAILEALGFVTVETVTKRRRQYEHRGVTICLDEVEELGEFVELETQVDAAEFDAATGRIDAVWSELDLGTENVEPTPYLTMLLEQGVSGGRQDESDPDSSGRSP